ncbi:MAG: hypothetical protein AB1807_11905 [Pseudomonadota bacterium]
MRTNLWDDPRVSQLCDLTDQHEAAVIGGLYWLWATADEHSSDGLLHGMTIRAIDRKTGIPGLGNALVTVGWLSDNGDSVTVSRFDEHNGASAKQRAQTAKRVANHKGNAKVTQAALPKADDTVTGALPREDKRREEAEKDKTTTDACAPAGGGDPLSDDLDPPKAAPLPARQDLPAPTSPALALTLALRPLGVSALSTNPMVIGWADRGVSVELLAEAVRIAREHKGDATIPPQYLAPIVERLLNPPGDRRAAPRPGAVNEKFNFSHLDRSGDRAAMEASMQRHGITVPGPDEDIEI